MTAPTRRALLASPPAAIIAVAVPAVAIPQPAAAGTSPDMARLIAAVAQRAAECRDHDDNVHQPAWDRMDAAMKHARATLPHVTVPIVNLQGEETVWSTASSTNVAVCKALAKRRPGDPGPFEPARIAGARKVVAAHHRRERAIKRAGNCFGVAATAEESNRRCDLLAEAEEAVANHPVSSIADLHAKLALMAERCMGDGFDRTAMILADVTRIMGANA